jgi:hypothetical protein
VFPTEFSEQLMYRFFPPARSNGPALSFAG